MSYEMTIKGVGPGYVIDLCQKGLFMVVLCWGAPVTQGDKT